MNIDKTTHKITKNNHHSETVEKKQIIISNSLRKKNYHIIRLKHKEIGNTKEWNMFTVSRNGTIFQHFDENFYSDFIGNKKVDKQSISIVIENMCCLLKRKGFYVNWLGEVCNEKDVINKNWLGFNFWERYNDIQIESLALLCRFLCKKHNIPTKMIDFKHFNKTINNFNGIVFKSNFFQNSNDTNPSFDIQKFNEHIN